MRTLVTGGAGFIGSHIAESLLARGDDVAIIDDLSTGRRENIPHGADFVETDIRNAAAVRKVFERVKPQVVFHQAAQMSVGKSMAEPGYDAEINVVGLLNVFAAAVGVGTERIIFASSGGVLYGDVSVPAAESFPPAPISPYGISKFAGELYLQFFCREYPVTGVALRYSNVFGPRQNPHGEAGVVAIFCSRMLRGEQTRINGDGRYVRDYVYVTDVAAANVAACNADLQAGFHTFNVGTGQGCDVNELAERLRADIVKEADRRGWTMEVPAPEHGPARPGDLRSNLVDAAKAGTKLGWRPAMDLKAGLERTATWFADEFDGESRKPT